MLSFSGRLEAGVNENTVPVFYEHQMTTIDNDLEQRKRRCWKCRTTSGASEIDFVSPNVLLGRSSLT
jgi:hypothetical protein